MADWTRTDDMLNWKKCTKDYYHPSSEVYKIWNIQYVCEYHEERNKILWPVGPSYDPRRD